MFSRARRLQKPRALLPPCRPAPGGVWADVGCGDGVFTQVLLETTYGRSFIIGLDRDLVAISHLKAWAEASAASREGIRAIQGDLRDPLPFRGLSGILAANTLHFITDSNQGPVLERLLGALAPSGQLIVVEYNAARGSRAVPYPRRVPEWLDLINSAGFVGVQVAARAPSSFLGEMVAITGKRPS